MQSKDEYIAQGVAVGSQEGVGTGLVFKLSSQYAEIQKLFKKYTRNAKFQAGDVFIGEISDCETVFNVYEDYMIEYEGQ